MYDYDRLLYVADGTRDEVNIRLIGDCGMRRGEIHGLTYMEGLCTAGYIYIEQAATQSVEGWVLISPKSRRGRMVRAHNAFFKPDGTPKDIASLHEIHKGMFYSDGTYFRLLDAPLNEHRYYDLRHFHASDMLRQGMPDSYIASRLGHHPGVLQTTYQHLLPKFKSAMDTQVVHLLEASKPASGAKKRLKPSVRLV